MNGDHKTTVRADDFNKAAVLIREIVDPVINKEKFRILVEKNPESDRVTLTYRFE